MSKSTFKKFKKNDYSYDDEEYSENTRHHIDKRKEKRVERALKVKDISALIEDEDEFEDYQWSDQR
jgi:predicted esterase YcpF (UPF0227 family)